MLHHLNYYSRYNRIKNPQEIKSLLLYINTNNLVKCLDDSNLFCIHQNLYQRDDQSPIKKMRKNIFDDDDDCNHYEHKRHASYDPHRKKYHGKYDVEKQETSHKNSNRPEFSVQKIEENDQIDSLRNRTNLEDLNCLQTESIRHGEQSEEFSECEPANFPLIKSNEQKYQNQSINQSNEDNFSSIGLNNQYHLRKSGTQEHIPIELQQLSKSEYLQRAHLSDLEIDADSEIHHFDREDPDLQQNFEKLYRQDNHNAIYSNENDGHQYQYQEQENGDMKTVQQKIDEYDLSEPDSKKVVERAQEEEFSSNISNENEENLQEQRELYDKYDDDGLYSQHESQTEQEQEKAVSPQQKRKNAIKNMYFGYTNNDQMRIGYENYTRKDTSQIGKDSKIEGEHQKQLAVLGNDQKITVSIINESSNTASKISIPERKPFKKFMMNKKLNPRMATSTIVNDLGEKKPQKINFKKMMKTQKSENRVKFSDIVANRNNSKRQTTPNKSRLIQAFFQQN